MNYPTTLIGSRFAGRSISLRFVFWVSLSLLAAPALAQSGADKSGGSKAAEDLQCVECVGLGELEGNSVDSSKVVDGSLTRADLGFNPQEQVLEKCSENSAMWHIRDNGSVECREFPVNTDRLVDLASSCPPGSFLQLDPAGSNEWKCLSADQLREALGIQ